MKASLQDLTTSYLSAWPSWLKALTCLVLAAAIQWFSFPPGPAPWLAWVALIPLFGVLHFASARLSFITWGLFQSLTFAMGGLWTRHFMTQSMDFEPWKAFLVVTLCCLWSGVPHAVFGWVAARFRLTETITGTLGAAALLPLLVAFFPYPFPCDQSITQYQLTCLIQIVEIGGRELLYFCMLSVNGLLFFSLRSHHRKESDALKPAIGAAVIPGILIAYGSLRIESLDHPNPNPVSIGVVQAAVPPRELSNERNSFPPDYKPGALRMRPMSRDLAKGGELALIIWPELPVVLDIQAGSQDRRQIDETILETGAPLLFCTFLSDREAGESDQEVGIYEGRQISYLTGPNDNQTAFVVKQNLVPFGETLPFETLLPWLRSWFPKVGRMRSEGQQAPIALETGNLRVAPLICYDDMFTSTARSFADQGANLLVTQANDSWFGNNSSLDWRLASGVFRTIENRLPWVRVGNTGYTLKVDHRGKIHWEDQLPVFKRAIGRYEVSPGDPSSSLYPRTIWPVRILLGLLALWALFQRRTVSFDE